MIPSFYFGILLIVFIICIVDLIFVWHAVEQDLEVDQYQWQQSNSNGQQLEPQQQQQQQPQQPLPSNQTQKLPSFTNIDPEKQHALKILQDAGVSITPEIIHQLPRWSDIVSQYGPKPIIQNLESCNAFRASIPKKDRYAAVAGLFNSGTNLLGNLMVHNCQIDGRSSGTGMRQQVPWGKHNPPTTHRLKNVAKVGGKTLANHTLVFPLVIIKDPYHWTVSQCRHRYSTMWEHDTDHCPNIDSWKENGSSPSLVSVKYALETKEYTTLIGLWNSWYNEYEQQSSKFPFASLRFEDILFHAEEVVTQLCRCVEGRRRRGKFKYPEDSVKPGDEGSNGLVSALLRYGDPKKRLEGWTEKDLKYAHDNLDQSLMNKYGYSHPDWL